MDLIRKRQIKKLLLISMLAVAFLTAALYLSQAASLAARLNLPMWVTIGLRVDDSAGESSFGSQYSVTIYRIPEYALAYIGSHADGANGWRGEPLSRDEVELYFSGSRFAKGKADYFHMDDYDANLAYGADCWYYRDIRADSYYLDDREGYQNLTGEVIAFVPPSERMLIVFYENL